MVLSHLRCDTRESSSISEANCLVSHALTPVFSRLMATATPNVLPAKTVQLAPPPISLSSLNCCVAPSSSANGSSTLRGLPPPAVTPMVHSRPISFFAAVFKGMPVAFSYAGVSEVFTLTNPRVCGPLVSPSWML